MKLYDIKKTETIKIEHVMEAANKSYILKNRHAPIRFYKSKNEFYIGGGEEYIVKDVLLRDGTLRFGLYPIDKWVEDMQHCNKEKDDTDYALYSIVNSDNIVQIVDFEIWESIWKAKYKKQQYLTEEETNAIVDKYYNMPVVCTFGDVYDRDAEYYPVYNTCNVYNQTNERMRFFFTIRDCKHCEYCKDDRCVNVMSDHFDYIANRDKCKDFVEA